ncbi:toprim domain-containing protein [Polynucleobacter rarus]|uniref:toprim domain-containing protein n=1 Tax=Polynucleobacter rarus TaxID=556055 RepID=UPI000D3E1E12|nr:toprim domain-containing protein [Polynucleobacter rarus]
MNNFYDFIQNLGYEPNSEIIPNKFIRFGKNKSVSAKLFADGQGGYLKDWRSGDKHFWFANDFKNLSSIERKTRHDEIERIKQAHEMKQAQIYKEVGIKSKELFMSSQDALVSHPYLLRKKVKPFDIRQQGNNLLIPVCSVLGEFQSIQFINQQGDKWFSKGGISKGGCHFIGEISMSKPIYIAEGYATTYSVYEDTGCLSIVAFNAMNLVPVAVELRKHLPDIEIIIAGDSDQTGKHYAELASKTVNGSTSFPPFTENQQGTDWNDYFKGVS